MTASPFDDAWGGDDRRNRGSWMAGSAEYGDLSDYLVGRNARECHYRQCSVKLLSAGGDDVLWGEYA